MVHEYDGVSEQEELPRMTAVIGNVGVPGGTEPEGADPAGLRPLPTLSPLYTTGQVRGGAFLGGPLAAVWILALNYRSMKESALAKRTLVFGLLATVVVFTIAYFLPESMPRFVIGLGLMIGAGAIADQIQGSRLAKQMELGAKRASNWKVVGIACTSLVISLTILIGVVFAITHMPSEDFGPDEHVYYQNGATSAEARSVGTFLEEYGFFGQGGPADVVLNRTSNGYKLDLMVIDSAITDTELESVFSELAQELSVDALNGKPVDLRLCSDINECPKTISWRQAPKLQGDSQLP